MKKLILILLSVMVIGALVLNSCGKAEETPTATTTQTQTVTATQTQTATTTQTQTTPTPTATVTQRYGGILRNLGTANFQTNIGWPWTFGTTGIRPNMYVSMEQLMRIFRKDAHLEPYLATSWELAPDSLSITFHLRKGVKFHDGSDFKADAVKFMFDQNIAAATVGSLNWKSCDIIDDYTARINFTSWNNTLWETLAGIGCSMLSPTAYQKYGRAYMESNPVGTGPFKFVELKESTYVKYTKFNDYWQPGKPYLDGFEFIYVKDPTTLDLAFLAGEGDVCDSRGGKTMHDMAQKGYEVAANLQGVANLVFPNNPDSPFANLAVREAVEYAIDKQAVAQAMGYGFFQATNQFCPPGHPAYDPTIVGRDYNPGKAKQLLKDAGFPNGIQCKILTANFFQTQAIMFQQYLNTVGINTELVVMDYMATMQITTTSDWKGYVLNYAHGFTPNWLNLFKGVYAPYGNYKLGMITPKGLKELVDAASVDVDNNQFIKDVRKIIGLIHDQATIIPVYADAMGWVISPRVHDFAGQWSPETNAWRPDTTWLSEE